MTHSFPCASKPCCKRAPGTGINPQTPVDATIQGAQSSTWAPDAGLGIYYRVKGFYTGFSIPQIFQSTVDFGTVDPNKMNKLVRHYNLVVGKEFTINEKVKLDPSVLLKATKAAPVQLDIALITTLFDVFWFGPSYRTNDAVAILAGVNIKKQFEIGYSYDFTTSALNDYSHGSHEVVLKYKIHYGKDTDGDGVIDRKEKCPDIPCTIANHGCPEETAVQDSAPLTHIDSDGDGVNDDDDKCPNTVGPPENEGCPIVEQKQQAIIDSALVNLEFETNKAQIKDYSLPYLDRLAELLTTNKDWEIKLVGHTDNTGTPEYNMTLSRDRANAVMFYLLSKGVSKKQVQVEYHGDTQPIAPNDTEQGRQMNRRVEMKLVFD